MEGKEEAARLQQMEQSKYLKLMEEKVALEKRLAKVRTTDFHTFLKSTNIFVCMYRLTSYLWAS